MKIYYCSEYVYNVGDILHPKIWRKFLESLPANSYGVAVDVAFEHGRKNINNKSVSRLDCLYGFTNATDAENYAGSKRKIYELEICDPTTPTSLHNYCIISYFIGQLKGIVPSNLLIDQHLIDDYWNGVMASHNKQGILLPSVEEIHIGGSARVIKIF